MGLRGTLRMVGVGRHARDIEIVFDGELRPEITFTLASIVRDRFGMWFARDFGDRPPFDEFFAGATIAAPNDAGEFAVAGGRVAAVGTAGGLVRSLRYADGGTRKLVWKAIDGVQVAVRTDDAIESSGPRGRERRDAAMHVTHVKVGEHFVPATILLERSFGRDWGPETIVLRDVRVQ